MTAQKNCELCSNPGGEIIYRHEQYRIVLVDDVNFPGFCRVIWNHHAAEMSDLPGEQRVLLMETVWQVEQAVCDVMQPDKMNIASLGNMVPHVHWHVIPRFQDDTHFPNPIWGEARRTAEPNKLAQRKALLSSLRQEILRRVGQSG